MQLFGTHNSPYTRIVRVIANELGFVPALQELHWRSAPQETFTVNPTGRVPVLVDGELRLFESRVIAEYLLQHPRARPSADLRPPGGPKHWEEQNLISLAYAILDTGGILRAFGDLAGSHAYLDRAAQRVRECFEALNAASAQGRLIAQDGFGMAEICAITAFEAAQGARFLPELDLEGLRQVVERHRQRASIANTTPNFA